MATFYGGHGNVIEIGGAGVSDLGAYANNLKGANWLCIGDSITAQDQSYKDTISSQFGVNLYGTAHAGGANAGYAAGDGPSMYPKAKANAWASTAPSPDIVTVCLGTNDFANSCPLGTIDDDPTTQTEESFTFYGCYKGILHYINQHYGWKPVVLITPPRRSLGDTVNGNGNTLDDFVEAIKEIGGLYSYPVVDLYHASGMPVGTLANSGFGGDGLHPSAEGWTRMAAKIYYAMNEAILTITG